LKVKKAEKVAKLIKVGKKKASKSSASDSNLKKPSDPKYVTAGMTDYVDLMRGKLPKNDEIGNRKIA
jgi:hypothetical protein